MPRTIESILSSREDARSRVATGKPVWDEKVEIKKYLHNDDLSFGQTRDRVVSALKASRWFRKEEFSDLHDAVEEMADAETVEHFDLVLDAIYDMADADRIWLG